MKLISFRVTKFRNIVDSGEISVDKSVTCFVGKNEAGKSGLLEALYLFNPAYGDKLSVDEHYPRWLVVQDRRKGNLGDHAPITVNLELEAQDIDALEEVLGPDVVTATTLSVSKKYSGGTYWSFEYDDETAIRNVLEDLPEPIATKLQSATTLRELNELINASSQGEDASSEEDIQAANTAIKAAGLDEVSIWQRIVDILKPQLPSFFRFTQYSTLLGRIDFRQLAKESEDGPGRSALQTARALLSLAGTDIKQLGNEDYELRKGELEAVQIDLTQQVFEYWKQNTSLEVLIDVDKETLDQGNGRTAVARFLDIRLRDQRTGYSNNFNQRSSGFQWFFSFLAAFSEFEEQDSPIVLLDEPALTLHARAQADFLRFINERLAPIAQVLYTTHSPFMIEPDALERVRIVEDKGPPLGAVCSEDVLTSDPSSLFPLQAALGYDIGQSLFVGPNNLVVEGTSDFIYLTVMSQFCLASNKEGLDSRWRILPAGGATNIPTFVSLVGPHLDVTVLADSDTQGMQRVTSMIGQKLLSGHRLVLANVATGTKDADLEDLFTDGDYLKLFNKTFGTTTKVADLPPGSRIVKRLEAHSGKFIHGKVAETLLREHQSIALTDTTLNRFSALFMAINKTIGN